MVGLGKENVSPGSIRHLTAHERPIPRIPASGVVGGAELRLQRLRGRTVAGSTRVLVWVGYRNGVFAEGGFDACSFGFGGGQETGVDCVVHQGMGSGSEDHPSKPRKRGKSKDGEDVPDGV